MTSPTKDVLKTLSLHADVVEQTRRDGTIVPAQDASEASVAALQQANALRPAGEDGFRLHPKLRDFLNDHLQLFPSAQRFDRSQLLLTDSLTRPGRIIQCHDK